MAENTLEGNAVHLGLVELEELFDLFAVVSAAPGLSGVTDPLCIGSKELLDQGPVVVVIAHCAVASLENFNLLNILELLYFLGEFFECDSHFCFLLKNFICLLMIEH